MLACAAAPARAAEPYDIDAILPLTGPNSFVGNEQRQSFEILQAEVNRGGGVHGRAIRFVIVRFAVEPADRGATDQPDPGQASGAHHRRLGALDVRWRWLRCSANGPLQFCLSPGFIPPPGGTPYSIGTPPAQQARRDRCATRKRSGWTRMAMLNQNDATGDSA